MSMLLSMSLDYNPVFSLSIPTPSPTIQSTPSPMSQPSINVALGSFAPITSSLDANALKTKAAMNAAPLAARNNVLLGNNRSNLGVILSAVAGTILVVAVLGKLKKRSMSAEKCETDSNGQEEPHTVANNVV